MPKSKRKAALGSILPGEAAFTLVEVLVAVALGLITVTGFFAFQSYQLQTLTDQNRQAELQGTARSVAELVAREVRNAGANPQCQTFDAVAEATRTSLRIKADLEPSDGNVTGTNEDLTYQWSPTDQVLQRIDHSTGQTETLLSGVDLSGSEFRYFNGQGNQLVAGSGGLSAAQRGLVRRIRFDLELTAPNSRGTEARARASTNIDLRNRFFLSNNTLCP